MTTVSLPASVPRMSGRLRLSISRPTAGACPDPVRTTTCVSLCSIRMIIFVGSPALGRLRMYVKVQSSRSRRSAPSNLRSRDTVLWVVLIPCAARS